jgi:hypothetical protein
MNTRLTRLATATLAAAALALIPTTAHAGQSNGPGLPSSPSTWTCRQYNHIQPYTYHGVQSEACDGYAPDSNKFGGDVDAIVWNARGVLKSCTVQLNTVRNHRAYPMRGYSATSKAIDNGHVCDAQAFWKLPRGYYNVTTKYQSTGGVRYETVQGPVVYWPGS